MYRQQCVCVCVCNKRSTVLLFCGYTTHNDWRLGKKTFGVFHWPPTNPTNEMKSYGQSKPVFAKKQSLIYVCIQSGRVLQGAKKKKKRVTIAA
jgi:hypothetical protein